jgi:four helix bundle protein
MSDYKSLPAWKRGMTLAHAVYAAADQAGLGQTDLGRRLRKTSVQIPSLIGEAFLDAGGREADEALSLAGARLGELESLLAEEASAGAIPSDERDALRQEIAILRGELDAFCVPKLAH